MKESPKLFYATVTERVTTPWPGWWRIEAIDEDAAGHNSILFVRPRECIGPIAKGDRVIAEYRTEGGPVFTQGLHYIRVDEDYDPSPWCQYCGAMDEKDCNCVIAENH